MILRAVLRLFLLANKCLARDAFDRDYRFRCDALQRRVQLRRSPANPVRPDGIG